MDDTTKKLIEAHRSDLHRAPDHFVQQWHATIDRAADIERGKKRRASGRPGYWAWGTAIPLALVVGIGFGVLLTGTPPTSPDRVTDIVSESIDTTPANFARGLQYHLRDSRARLANYQSGGNRTGLVLDIVEQNRLFEAAAENNEAHDVARVLRAFESVLLRLAADDLAPEDAESLQRQLSFELNVVLTKLARESSDQSHTS